MAVLPLDKAPRPSISNGIWILSSDTICQLNQLFSNSEAAMLSRQKSWSLANPGIVNALPWQQDFRGVDPSLSCLEPVVFIMPVSIETCWLLIVDLHIAKPSTSCHGSCYPEWIHLNAGAIQFNGYHSHLYLCIFLFFCESLYWATYFCKLSYQITFNCMLLYKITI